MLRRLAGHRLDPAALLTARTYPAGRSGGAPDADGSVRRRLHRSRGTAALGERLAAFAVRAERAARRALAQRPPLPDPHVRRRGHPCRSPGRRWRSSRPGPAGSSWARSHTSATYRHPGVLLKTVATLDVLSGGRAWLGIGPPWHERSSGTWASRSARGRSASPGWRRSCG
ncbi:LLM class flavin-dependent oxidoreductase [Micromonospora sp. b486]|uniref:LLM class flavin-dependent oxidoreductase n=1 Tax=Micromonospora sp. b486 TaxID=3053986 RepID=UPI00338DA2FE